MMGIFSKTMNKEGAIVGMLLGLGVTLFYVFAHRGIMFVPGTAFVESMGLSPNFFFGITPEAFGTVGAIVNFVAAFLVMKMTAPAPDHIQHMVEDVRVPRGAGTAVDH
jgi:cation/acetate symporter